MSEFRELFSKAKHIAIITGAGVSAESGVPTFRGANETWRKWKSQVDTRHPNLYRFIYFRSNSVFGLIFCVPGIVLLCGSV